MLIKETYKPFGSKLKHFEDSYQKYLQSRIRNDEDFIYDFVESLDIDEIEKILSKYQNINSLKEKELISFIDNTKNIINTFWDKAEAYKKQQNETLTKLSYSRQIVYLVKELINFQDVHSTDFKLVFTNSYYRHIRFFTKVRLGQSADSLRQTLTGLNNFNIENALESYLVYDEKSADILFEKAMVSESSCRKYAFEALLNDLTIHSNSKHFIPQVIYSEKEQIGFNRIDVENLQKKLILFSSFYSPREFRLNNYLNRKDIKDEGQFLQYLSSLFKQIDKGITVREVKIFFYSISLKDNPAKYSNNDLIIVQNKINNSFINDRNASRILCAFIYKLKEFDFIKANSLTKSLEDYFMPEVQLSKSTFDKYVYRETESELNYDNFKDIINDIIPDSVLGLKNRRQKRVK